MLAQLTAAYPGLTGVQPTGAVSRVPQAGDMIKNLMLGTAFLGIPRRRLAGQKRYNYAGDEQASCEN